MCAEALQMIGGSGLVRREFEDAISDTAGDTIERQIRDSSTNLFGGGSNDVQRDIIGFHGLGLPR
jgi:alkylation response protein AidB-like acyl-CoA dehydrogenase